MGAVPILGAWNRRMFTQFVHKVVVGAAGAITSQDAATDSGIVATYNAVAGQYLIQLPSKTGYRVFHGAHATYHDATASTPATGGYIASTRTNNVDAGTRAGTFILQWSTGTAGTPPANADIQSGGTFYVFVFVSQ